MKKLINDVDTIISESLDGFVAAHGDIVTLGARSQVRSAQATEARQGCTDFRRGFRPRAAACRFRRARHARCCVPWSDLHVANP